ncbi:MAG: rhomboid family intramembrane serine protease [Bacteroidota bacterium]
MITYFIIGITALVSYIAFTNRQLMENLQFNAAKIIHRKQYYRLISHALLHAGWTHLFVNMLVLLFFGVAVEQYFGYFFGRMAGAYFLLLYVGGTLFSNLIALFRHKNNYYYNAIGASGAVAAVLFTFIFLNPWEKVYFFGIIPIPGIIFAGLYLLYSYQMSRKELDNVAHDAHFMGALFGFIFPVILRPHLFDRFIDQLFRMI